jgi:hypothetical protein
MLVACIHSGASENNTVRNCILSSTQEWNFPNLRHLSAFLFESYCFATWAGSSVETKRLQESALTFGRFALPDSLW